MRPADAVRQEPTETARSSHESPESNWRELLEESRQAWAVVASDTLEIRWSNRRFKELCGSDAGIGLQHNNGLAPLKLLLQNAFAHGAPPPSQRLVLHRDGHERVWNVSVRALTATPEGPELAVTIDDVTVWAAEDKGLHSPSAGSRVLCDLIALAAETDSFETVIQGCLTAICQLTGWPVGHAWRVACDHTRLESLGIWYLDDADAYAALVTASEKLRFERGQGMPGAVWERREPLWLDNLEESPGFIRLQQSPGINVRAAFAFPVIVAGDVEAVLEFFSPTPTPLDADLLLLMRAAGEQVGRVMERKRQESEWKRLLQAQLEERTLYHEVLSQMPLGVVVCEPGSGRVLFSNPHVEKLTGYTAAVNEPIMRAEHFKAYRPDGSQLTPRDWPLSRAFLNNETVQEEEIIFQRKDGARASLRASAAPIMDASGKVLAAVSTFYDITERRLTEDRLNYMAEASQILASSLNYEETLSAVARLVVPRLADWCAVDMVDEDGGVQRLAVAHADPEKVKYAHELQERYPIDLDAPRGVPAILRTGQPEFIPYISEELLIASARDADQLEILRELGLRSYIGVPLMARERVLGVLTLINAESGRLYAEDDFKFARELAVRAAAAVDNALLYRQAQQELAARVRLTQELNAKTRSLETLNRINYSIAAELELDKLVQQVTDAATELSGAAFGAFFYNVIKDDGEAYTLYTLSGAPREAFSRFPMPRNTKIFSPTFTGEGVRRFDDVTQAKEYGQNPPHHGMPEGHLPVRSYLAVPVVSRSGEVLGGLFFGHSEPGVFTEESERIVLDIAKQAAIAVDNSRLYAAAQKEIQDRKAAQEALHSSEERLRFTLESAHVGTWNWDMRTDHLEWSDNLLSIHGIPPESFNGTFEDFQRDVHEADREQVQAAIQQAIGGDGTYRVEYRLNRADGALVWVEGKGRVLYDEQRAPMGMAGICMDITERKLAESRFRAAVESSPSAVVMVDANGKITLLNSQTEHIFGYERGELLGNSVELLVPERYRTRHPMYRAHFHSGPEVRPMGMGRELFGRRKDGTEFPVEIGLNPIQMADGVYVLSTILDITERKKSEDALTAVNAELRQKNAELEQFVYTVSHDLKSPLVTAMGFIGLIKEDLEAGQYGEVMDSFNRLERSTLRMSDLIDDLLELSRIGRVEHEYSEVDVAQVVRELAEELGDRIRQAGAEVVIEEPMCNVYADPVRVTEVFENLLTNALKYGCPQPGAVITVGMRTTDDECQFYVRDQGPGIAPQYQEKIFGLFQRLDNRGEGTGVGLTIVARIMQFQGGRVWVESTPGEGATFLIAFPRTSLRTRVEEG